MMFIELDELVELKQDIPDMGLHRGDVGLVCSTWFSPTTAYEVEFQPEQSAPGIRAWLVSSQIQKAIRRGSSDTRMS
jgi:uncharacterized protein DUF4926